MNIHPALAVDPFARRQPKALNIVKIWHIRQYEYAWEFTGIAKQPHGCPKKVIRLSKPSNH